MNSPFDLMSETEVFRDRDLLTDDEHPEYDDIYCREEEITAYVNALRPVIKGGRPNNIFVYGETGVGKTAVTKIILPRLNEKVEAEGNGPLTVVYHNCKNHSSYQVILTLVNKLKGKYEADISHGASRPEALQKLFELIDEKDGVVMIALDEIDSIIEKTDEETETDGEELLYEIPRARNARDVTTPVGLIGISNDYTIRHYLSERVRATLTEKEIQFPSYDSSDLETILSNRAGKAFLDGVLEDGVIPKCSAMVGRDTGSSRDALDILREAGDVAIEQGDETVTIDHVETARKRVERGRIEQNILDLTLHKQLTFLSIIHAERDEDAPVKSEDIYNIYTAICEQEGYSPLTKRRVRDHLRTLHEIGFIESSIQNQGRNGGRVYYYESMVAPELVLSVIDQGDLV